ncbi:hypothetical protein A3F29_00660 [Candidatus Roizmanbacteria bacterium RIFCSPHIGHO2_12_FULL_33_9]|uniref:Uncharacterized protein n=1 Tax=Candidatus Roizmanbacteria bacterium RIFCSPHIGHO2_12_FULL_33_9 TaxID=1802045 RepID=A0A1F7HJH3_9BACT|nr:MAG: hypothetical protein A3F29_00660 [Candidatus Roizmanbacteria bacterium RIFCSPHIGHO2_12_FULL_33_9]
MVERSRTHQPKKREQPFNGLPQTHALQDTKQGSPAELRLHAPRLAENRFQSPVSLGIENPMVSDYAKRLPNLLDDRRIRVDPFNGSIYIRSWRRTTRQKVDERQGKLFSDEENTDKVSLKRWNRYPDIESAIRSARYVVENYSPNGKTSENLNTILVLVEDLFDGFTNGDITFDNLDEHIDYSLHVLEEAGLLRAQIPNRIELKQQILAALNKDKLGRGNILISRTRLAAATIKILEEKLIAGQTQEKYNYLLVSQLYVERMTERLFLDQVTTQAIRFLSLPENHRDLPQAEINLETFAKTFLDPERIKASPYRGPALIFLAYVFGWPQKDAKIMKKILRTLYSKEGLDVVPVIDKIHETGKDGSIKAVQAFRERVSHGLRILEDALALGERNLESKTV